MSDYYDLGTYSRPVSTSSSEAQVWFDRGLNWSYGFNHEEAVRCFERAAEFDPRCAMAHWGIAYASGPNYNRMWDAFDPDDLAGMIDLAYAATGRALELASGATPVEQAIIATLRERYPAAVPVEDCSIWNNGYAAAMRDVHGRFPADLDVAALAAEAMMNRTPWQLWDLVSGEPADGADTAEAIEVLERALADGGGRHPGLLHFYVHAMEMSPHPERALLAGDTLRDLVPDAGHLRHMATHIDVLCGNYRDVVVSNQAAIVADRKFYETEGPYNFYTLYRCHDYHFKLYGAMFLGQPEPALEAAGELVAQLTPDVLTAPGMADYLESFVGMRLHALIRFGRFEDILALPFPEDRDLYCVTDALLHYAKGVAHASLGDVAAADREHDELRAAAARVPESRYLFNNTAADILEVAAAMLEGEVEYRRGNHDQAFAHLRRSVELDDGLPYDEPWGWMQPARHALGALLLEQGRIEEAEAVYRADLGLDSTLRRPCQHPDNVWSLHGYHECLRRLGKDTEADLIRPRLELALARATVPIKASCFCRRSALAAAS
jgi:tetratricopeptide (TPR) repeat protein